MGGFRRTVLLGVVLACLFGTAASAQVPLPPPPTLPPVSVPPEVEPALAVAGPTAGPVCGTASLLALLAPSLVQGYFKIPLSMLVDSESFRSYANTALYVCGFVPFPLTPTQCQADRSIVDALRGLNPLAAQVVGLSAEGATVDTILAMEQLLPPGPSVAGQLADELELLMACSRSAGPPATPSPSVGPTMPPPVVLPSQPLPVGRPAPPGLGRPPAVVDLPPGPSTSSVRPPAAALPRVFEARLIARSGVQPLGVALGFVLLAGSILGWYLGRGQARTDDT